MATLLLIVIFTAFIGLGVPDSLLGSAWPAICEDLGISQALAWTITTPISCFTLFSSIISAKVIEKLGAKTVAFISTLLTALALFFTSFANAPWVLVLLGFPLGLGAGAIDSALNNYVALHYKASHMNFLHCFYGVGVASSPYLMSLALSFTTWRDGYRYASLIQTVIAVIILISFPLWKIHEKKEDSNPLQTVNYGSYKEVLKNPVCIPVCVVLLCACAIECTCGLWATTYLVIVKGASNSDGALYLVTYYAGLAMGRFLSGVLSKTLSLNTINLIGITVIALAVISLMLPINYIVIQLIALFLIGLGIGPIYPNMSFLTPKHFGENNSQKAMGVQMAGAYVGILLSPTLLGILSSAFTLEVFPIYHLALVILLATSYLLYQKFYKRQL